MPTTKENFSPRIPILKAKASLSSLSTKHGSLQLRNVPERLSSTSPRSSPRSPTTRSPDSPLKSGLPKTFVNSFAALTIKHQTIARAEFDSTPAFTKIFEKRAPTVPKAPNLQTEQRALKRSNSPVKMGGPPRNKRRGPPRRESREDWNEESSYDGPEEQHEDQQHQLSQDDGRRSHAYRQTQEDFPPHSQRNGSHEDFLPIPRFGLPPPPAALMNHVRDRQGPPQRPPQDVADLVTPLNRLRLPEAESLPRCDSGYHVGVSNRYDTSRYANFQLPCGNNSDNLPGYDTLAMRHEVPREHQDGSRADDALHQLRRNLSGLQMPSRYSPRPLHLPARASRSPTPDYGPAYSVRHDSGSEQDYDAERIREAFAGSVDHSMLRSRSSGAAGHAHRGTVNPGSSPIEYESEYPSPRSHDLTKSSRSTNTKHSSRHRAKKRTKKEEGDDDDELPVKDEGHWDAKNGHLPRRRKDDDDEPRRGHRDYYPGNYYPTYSYGGEGSRKEGSGGSRAYQTSTSVYTYGGTGPEHPAFAASISAETCKDGFVTPARNLNAAAAWFVPQNGRFEQILPREQLVRSYNWHKEEGKIPCGFSERAKFNQGRYRCCAFGS